MFFPLCLYTLLPVFLFFYVQLDYKVFLYPNTERADVLNFKLADLFKV